MKPPSPPSSVYIHTHNTHKTKQDNPLPWLPLPVWQAVQALCDQVDGFAKFGQVRFVFIYLYMCVYV